VNRQAAREQYQFLVFSHFVVGFRIKCRRMAYVAILMLRPGDADGYGIRYPVGDILNGDIGAFRYLLNMDAVPGM
jgi:hypothetical protein